MAKFRAVALFLTLATCSNVSAAPRGARVIAATMRALAPPQAKLERIATLLSREQRARGVEIAARWMHEAPEGHAAIVGDRVILVEADTFRAVSLRSGATLREAEIPGCSTAYSRDQQTLYAGCENGVALVDPETLAVRWQRQWPSDARVAHLADAGGALVVSLEEGDSTELLALERDGATRWRTRLPGRWIELRSDGDALLAFEHDPTVWRLDPRSGRVLWSRTVDDAIDDVLAISSGVTAIVRAESLSLVDDQGRELLTRPRNPHLAAFSVRGSRLLACDDDGVLHMMDVRSGRKLWWAQVSAAGEPCAVLGVTDERVLVAGPDRVMALDATRAAPPAPAVTIHGRIDSGESSGVAVRVGTRRVHTNARGRFVATVRAHGPIAVRVVDKWGIRSQKVVWPDEHARRSVLLTNYIDDSCH
jgi:hypothetical protein